MSQCAPPAKRSEPNAELPGTHVLSSDGLEVVVRRRPVMLSGAVQECTDCDEPVRLPFSAQQLDCYDRAADASNPCLFTAAKVADFMRDDAAAAEFTLCALRMAMPEGTAAFVAAGDRLPPGALAAVLRAPDFPSAQVQCICSADAPPAFEFALHLSGNAGNSAWQAQHLESPVSLPLRLDVHLARLHAEGDAAAWALSFYVGANACWQLRSIKVERCDEVGSLWLTQLLESIGTQLQHLDLAECEQLTALPDCIGGCIGLQHLRLVYCQQLVALPDSIGGLTQLQSLDLAECEQLTALPDSIGGCTGLQSLDLAECEQLTALPDSMGGCRGCRASTWQVVSS